MTANDGEFSLLRLVPGVLRARDFRLYTQGGRRLIDLWQNGGAAILGHTPPSLLRELKNTASRGLYAPLPHFLEQRFIKALSHLFPGRSFRLYNSAPAALDSLIQAGTAALWRPFLDPAASLAALPDTPALVPVLPGIQGWRGGLPQGLCVLALSPAFESENSLPPGEFLPPVLLAVATRGIYDLITAAPERAKPAYPRIARALKESPWQRRGIYLTLHTAPAETDAPAESEAWPAFFRRFLEAGFLLPPIPSHPLILPGVLSPGEEAKLAMALQRA
ncbi:hypothetical protein AGMMS50293_12430 [Spirochaetia bacterium]|nr:hypothetical protein AGMMS50293_12430 [Spirochaetia bacterium]